MALRTFPADWTRAVFIVAHPDDVEYGAGAAVAKWISEGRSVTYVMITSGEQGIEGMVPELCGPLREKEQISSSRVVGVEDIRFLRFPDYTLENTQELRDSLVDIIRELDPELVLTLNFRDNWGGEFQNSPDHMNAGQAVVEAVRAAAANVRWIAAAASPEATHAVDVTGFEDTAIASLREHRAYLAGLGGGAESLKMIRESLASTGAEFGTGAAVSFELIDVA
ncbi:PIG-L deacetylase family protein [Hoyosella altamirensis]|uniref:LmbE family N-acetylglucosaminyl deacetylase n=1 Tax=Hoyosella altamirensis TaxID=616997 RepID=A0A839RGP2_9ACTN|nr:PIG-L family deacetylase [Hoyosella altamirensis]MBB3035892.1 LmbE family N-acetylglucosaminyl deacetylase [Hoyosella altamirensis]